VRDEERLNQDYFGFEAAEIYKEVLKDDECWEALDLVALSLVCDVVPLNGENRILLKEGLKVLKTSQRAGIKALCQAARIKQENLDTFHLGFILGPRINASGRVAHAKESLGIFLTDDEKESLKLSLKLCEYNQVRKNIESVILKEALAQSEKFIDEDWTKWKT